MPAVELNSEKPDHHYNKNRQNALLKLWLILTSNEQVVNPATTIFERTADADVFCKTHAGSPQRFYFVDLEKLTASLKYLELWEVKSVFDVLKVSYFQQASLIPVAHQFWNQGAQLLGYGHVGCNTINTILDI